MSPNVRWRALSLAPTLAFLACAALAAPPKYRITPIDIPSTWDPAGNTLPVAINNSGTVMGQLRGDDIYHIFRYSESGGTADLSPASNDYFWPHGMNRKGEIVGEDYERGAFIFRNNHLTYLSSDPYVLNDAIDVSGQTQIVGHGYTGNDEVGYTHFGYVWKKGVTTPLPNGPFSYLNLVASDDEGAILGNGNFDEGGPHPFIYKNGVFHDLIEEDGNRFSYGYADSFTSNGIVAGSIAAGGGQQAFVYKNGQLTDLGALGGVGSRANDVNGSGWVVGSAEIDLDPDNPTSHAFFYDGTTMRDIAPAGSVRSTANDITQNGQACGLYTLGDGSVRAFVFGVDGSNTFKLNSLVDVGDPSKPYVVLTNAIAMNEFGQIIAAGGDSRKATRTSFLVSPIDSTPPVIASTVQGTKGLGAWYTSSVAVSWATTDAQAPVGTKSGCGALTVSADTKSRKITCTAASIGGSTTKSTTVKRDSTAPSATVNQPAPGAVFNRNQVVKANFTCADATAGIKSCVGTVANGTKINTSKKVTNAQFKVTATDKAGLTRVLTATYSVK